MYVTGSNAFEKFLSLLENDKANPLKDLHYMILLIT